MESGSSNESGAVGAIDLPYPEFSQCGHRGIKLLSRTEPQMSTTDNRLHFLNTGQFTCRPDGIDQTGMAAAQDQRQSTLSLDDQRLVVNQLIAKVAVRIGVQSRIPDLERSAAANLAGEENLGGNLAKVEPRSKSAPRTRRKSSLNGMPSGTASPVSLTR